MWFFFYEPEFAASKRSNRRPRPERTDESVCVGFDPKVAASIEDAIRKSPRAISNYLKTSDLKEYEVVAYIEMFNQPGNFKFILRYAERHYGLCSLGLGGDQPCLSGPYPWLDETPDNEWVFDLRLNWKSIGAVAAFRSRSVIGVR